MLSEKVVNDIKALLPVHLHGFTYIAGGYAHNQDKAHDIDVWVLSRDNSNETQVAEDIKAHLVTQGLMRATEPLEAEPYDLEGEVDRRFFVVKTFANDELLGPSIQLLTTNAKTVQTLLNLFDITTHKIARPLLNTAVFYVGEGYFPLQHEPRVTRWDTPRATLLRFQKIASRYGFDPNPEDVAKLETLAQPASVPVLQPATPEPVEYALPEAC